MLSFGWFGDHYRSLPWGHSGSNPAAGDLYQPPPPPEGLGMIESYVGLELIMCGAVDEGDVMLFFIG